MTNRLDLAKEILNAIKMRKVYWRLLQFRYVLNAGTGDVYKG